MSKEKRVKKELGSKIKLIKIELDDGDLLFYEKFIKDLGGKAKAKQYLLQIIDRYFSEEYIQRDDEDEDEVEY